MKGKALNIFYKSTVVDNALPLNIRENDLQLFDNSKRIVLPESGLYLLKNVFVTDLGIIYQNFSAVKENITCYDSDFIKYWFRYFIKTFLKSRKLKFTGNKALIIFDNYSGPNGFAHWICDGLTRLAEMNDNLSAYTLIVPYYFKEQPIYTRSLSLFNVSAIHYLPKNSVTHFKELYFPTPIGETGNFHPDNVKKLQAIVRLKQASATPPLKNIYISRAKAQRRFVQNEKELASILQQYNFETVYLEEHTFEQQVEIIATAANIVSIHGAALSMLLFAYKGVGVLELRSNTDLVNNMYYIIANICELRYYYLSCNSIENSSTGNNFDLRVNISDFEKTLKQMIDKKEQ